LYANSAVFKVFDFELIKSSSERVLDDPFKIVLKEDVALKLFGNEDPLGKTLQVDSIGDFTVAGIIKKTNKKSHIQFETLVSASTLESLERSRKEEKTQQPIVNEYTIHRFSLDTPSEAIGKYLILDDSNLVQVIGVVKDYKYAALFLNQKSLILRVNPKKYNLAVFMISSPDFKGTIEKIRYEWKKIDPVHEMEGDFLDKSINESYSFFDDILYTEGYAC
jgi:hypothetical protein